MPLTMILSDHENSQTSLSLFDGINCPIYDDHEELNLDKLLDYPTGIVFAGTSNCDSIHAQTDSYNAEMRSRMGSDICYHHELGMNYTYILPELIVGSVPQTTDDINHLSEKVGITAILNLQHQCDWEKFGIDFGALQHRCHERGDINCQVPHRGLFLRKPVQAPAQGCVRAAESIGGGPQGVHPLHCWARSRSSRGDRPPALAVFDVARGKLPTRHQSS